MTNEALPLATDLGLHDHPMPIGPAADETTYLRDHPLAEAFIPGTILDGEGKSVHGPGMAVLKDNGQDLTETIGARTVRLHSFVGAAPEIADQHNLARHICGGTYSPNSNVNRLSVFDQITAPFGGRAACGPALGTWGDLESPVVLLTVKLPNAISTLLSVDGQQRDVELVLRDSDDASRRVRVFVVVRNRRNGGAILLRGTSLDAAYRHVRGSLRLGKKVVDKLAAELPTRISQHAELLRQLAATVLDEYEMHALAMSIAAYGEDEVREGDEIGWADRSTEIARLVKEANGSQVPASPVPGHYTALQLFEAACVLDVGRRSRSTSSRRLNRILDSDGVSDAALKVLSGWDGVLPETVPADWMARFRSVEQLPALDPLPAGLSLPPHVDLDQLRRVWCTTLAADDTDADERISRLLKVRDPLEVLAIVAPYVPVLGEEVRDAA